MLYQEIKDFFEEEAKTNFQFVHLEQDDNWIRDMGELKGVYVVSQPM